MLASVSLAAPYTTRLKLRDWIIGRRRQKGAARLYELAGVLGIFTKAPANARRRLTSSSRASISVLVWSLSSDNLDAPQRMCTFDNAHAQRKAPANGQMWLGLSHLDTARLQTFPARML